MSAKAASQPVTTLELPAIVQVPQRDSEWWWITSRESGGLWRHCTGKTTGDRAKVGAALPANKAADSVTGESPPRATQQNNYRATEIVATWPNITASQPALDWGTGLALAEPEQPALGQGSRIQRGTMRVVTDNMYVARAQRADNIRVVTDNIICYQGTAP